jgi:hypothetical protein
MRCSRKKDGQTVCGWVSLYQKSGEKRKLFRLVAV